VAVDYERFRPGPPLATIEWLLPDRVATVVDLGAGTGALTRLLVDRADSVVAVEPDDRMRAVLAHQVPAARAVAGRGESIPLPDGVAEAVLASSSWHWMDAVPALHEAGRVLVPGGVLGALWSGPDPESGFLAQAQALLVGGPPSGSDGSSPGGDGSSSTVSTELRGLLTQDARRAPSILEIADGTPFDQPDHEVFRWDMALTADDLVGLLGTFSWVLTLPDERRQRVVDEARRLLDELLGVVGDVTVDVAFRAEAWRARRH
jgi:SAM-dependent methyltransferase